MRTRLTGRQVRDDTITTFDIEDGTVSRVDMNTTDTGQAVITKVIAGTNVTISSTGVDAGTGDVTINAIGGSTAPTDHGDLSGLNNDDHIQYSLVDGTRAFTGTIAGINPIGEQDLTTKNYVDKTRLPNWEAETVFETNQILQHESKIYRVIVGYTSALTFTEDWESNKLELLGVGTAYIAEFITTDWTLDGDLYNISITNAVHNQGSTKYLILFVYQSGTANERVNAPYEVSSNGTVTFYSETTFNGYYIIGMGAGGEEGLGGGDVSNPMEEILDANSYTITNLPYPEESNYAVPRSFIDNMKYMPFNCINCGEVETEILTFFAYLNPASQTFSTTPITIQFNNIASESSNQFAISNGIITIENTCKYYIEANVSSNVNNNSRSTSQNYLEVNRGTGWELIPGSIAFGYHRLASHGYGSAYIQTYIYLEKGHQIRARAMRLGGGGTLALQSNACNIRIENAKTRNNEMNFGISCGEITVTNTITNYIDMGEV